MKDYNKHPYHGVGFSDVPEVLKALKVLEKHKLYEIQEETFPRGGVNVTTSHAIYPTLQVTRKAFYRDVRNALVRSDDVKIRDEDVTKDGQYRSDWIVLDTHALRICAARRGGFVCILEDRADFIDARNEWNRQKPVSLKQQELLQSAYDKLTPEERKATGLIYKRGIKK